ncbi:hypothetical protein V202x_09300 [Gimesia aquarii]|uniref:Uncharacterized protein n=1 Tax=Gimesia aquarii TaxID=2527964 RepID=A0A517WQM6_9PLAN|nr:hypothetical protein V202x_09300 [Gimesia aquarii]
MAQKSRPRITSESVKWVNIRRAKPACKMYTYVILFSIIVYLVLAGDQRDDFSVS